MLCVLIVYRYFCFASRGKKNGMVLGRGWGKEFGWPVFGLYTRYPIVARALGLGRVRARAKESCIQVFGVYSIWIKTGKRMVAA